MAELDASVAELDRRIAREAQAHETARRLMAVPGSARSTLTPSSPASRRPRLQERARLRGLARPDPAPELHRRTPKLGPDQPGWRQDLASPARARRRQRGPPK